MMSSKFNVNNLHLFKYSHLHSAQCSTEMLYYYMANVVKLLMMIKDVFSFAKYIIHNVCKS